MRDLNELLDQIGDNLPPTWYRSFWNSATKSYFPNRLDRLEELPLVPVVGSFGDLVDRLELSRTAPAKIRKTDRQGRSTSHDQDKLLASLGIEVVEGIPNYVFEHPEAKNYILGSNEVAEAILRQYEGAVATDKIASNARPWRKLLMSISSSDRRRLAHIIEGWPIFNTIHMSGGRASELVTAKNVRKALSFGSGLPARLPQQVISIADHERDLLSNMSHIEIMSAEQALRDEILPRLDSAGYSGDEIDNVGKHCLDNIRLYNNEGFRKALANAKFVCNGTSRRKPKDLLDPNDRVNRMLFQHTQSSFPKGTFAAQSYLGHLRVLGLRSSSGITTQELNKVARWIHSGKDKSCVISTSNALLKYFEENPQAYVQADIPGDVAWIPVIQKRPDSYPEGLTWHGEGNFAASLDEAKPLSQAHLVGSVVPVYKDTHLKIHTSLTISTVCAHFKNLLQMRDPHQGDVERSLREIYQFFTKQDMGLIQEELFEEEWVYHGSGYASPDMVVAKKVSSHLQLLSPYLFFLPQGMMQFTEFFLHMGCKEDLRAEDLADILRRIANHNKGRPIGDTDMEAVKMCAEEMHRHEHQYQDGQLFLPNTEKIMMSANSLCYRTPWLKVTEADDLNFLHEDFTAVMAGELGVKTNLQAVVLQHSETIGMPFGQKEKLLTRIKRILQGYPKGSGIIKELIQNADDAQARELHLIVDPRSHPTKNILCEGWKRLQGPALLIYNDRPFQQKDLEGIQNLGEGSKERDPNLTGQYGVGFNAVYHLTDTPTLMTHVDGKGKRLCVFDPQLKYVEGATTENPGRMFDVAKVNAGNRFTDTFACYQVPRLDLEGGTLFRLPLRTRDVAKSSEISNYSTTCEELLSMLGKFFDEEGEDCLLFLRHLHKIKISEIDAKNQLITVAEISANMGKPCQEKIDNFTSATQSDAGKEIEQITVQQVKHRVTVTKRYKRAQPSESSWLVIQQFGLDDPLQVSEHLRSMFNRKEFCLLPRGGVAYPTDAERRTQKKLFCFLPMNVEIDFAFHVNGHFALNYETRDDLILSSKDSVMAEWNKMLLTRVVTPCAVALIEEEKSLVTEESHLGRYLQIFPGLSERVEMAELGKAILSAAAKRETLPMINEDGSVKWLQPAEAETPVYFDGLEPYPSDRKEENGVLRSTVKRLGLQLLAPSTRMNKIFHDFKRCNISVCQMSGEVVFNHLKNFARDLPEEELIKALSTVTEVKVLVEYIKNFVEQQIQERKKEKKDDLSLEGLPILMDENGQLLRVGGTEIFTKYWDLFPSSKEKFLHHDLVRVTSFPPFPDMTFHDVDLLLSKEVGFLSGEEAIHYQQSTSKVRHGNARLGTVILEFKNGREIEQSWLRRVWDLISEIGKRESENKKKDLDGLKNALGRWRLVPANRGSQLVLVEVARAHALLSSNRTTELIETMIKEFHLLRRASAIVIHAPEGLYSNSGDFETVAHALREAEQYWKDKVVDRDFARKILSYLVSESLSDNAIEMVKALPIFPSSSALVPLSGRKAFMWPRSVPQNV